MANAAISFIIGASLTGAFKTTLNQASSQFGRLGAAMEGFQGKADKIAAFRGAFADLHQAKTAWKQARQDLARLKAEMAATENPSRALSGAFHKAQRAADLATEAFRRKGQAAREARAALDRAGIAVKSLAGEEKRLGAALDAAKAKMTSLNQIAELRQQRTEAIGKAMAAAVMPGAVFSGMKRAVNVAGDFEHSLMRFGNTAGFAQDQVDAVRRKILDLSETTNQTAPEMLEGLEVLVGRGLNPTQALASMEAIGRAATATGASVEDMAKTAFALQDSLNIAPEGLAKAIDSLAQSGKSGGFELRDMAKHLPVLTAQAAGLKMEGADAVASLGASLQLAFKGTGDADKAATNLTNFLSKITAKDAVENFQKMGIDLKEELTDAMTSGEDPILFMIERINELTDGDQFKLNELFGDMQAKQFILPMVQNLQEFKKIKAEALGASGVVDKDFERAMLTANERFKGVANAVSNFGEAIGRIFLPPLGWIANKLGAVVRGATWLANAFPNLTAGVMGAIFAFTSYRAALLAASVAQKSLGILGLQVGLGKSAAQALLAARGMGSMGKALALAKSGFVSFQSSLAAANAAIKTWVVTSAASAWGGLTSLPGKTLNASRAIWGYSKALTANAWTALTSVAGWQRMGAALTGPFVTGLQAAGTGIRVLGLAMLTTPIGLILTAIALGAAMIYKYWQPIAGFFTGVWQGVTQAIKPVSPALEGVGKAIAFLFAPLQGLWNLFAALLAPVEDIDGAAQAMGEKVGAWIGNLINGIAGFFGAAFEWLGKLADAAGAVWSWMFGGGGDKSQPAKLGDAVAPPANDNKPVTAKSASRREEPPKVGDSMPKVANDGKSAAGAAMSASASQKPALGNTVAAGQSGAAVGAAFAPSSAGQPGKTDGNVVQFRPSPSAPPPQSLPAATTVTVTITINAAPGMDERAIAQQVKLAIQDAMREADAKRRAANHD